MDFEIKDAAFEYLWKNGGKLEDGTKVKIQDALAVPNAPILMPKVISNIVKEAQEPMLVGTSLLQRINYSYGQTITFPAVGALVAADIAEGEEYPERSLQMGGSTVTASIGKSGVAVKITEEMIKYSQFDVIGMHLRAAGRALARHKEVKIFNHIRTMGVPVFDNVNPTSSLKGVTTGRDLTGAGNGSLTADDIFDAYAQIITQGFFPDTLLMHPLTWTMFVKDATLRSFVLTNGGGSWFATWTGNPASRAPWDSSSQGGLGVSGGQTTVPAGTPSGQTVTPTAGHYPFAQNSAPSLPGYLNIPFRIIVSPFVPYDARRKLTDIYMFDSMELGVLIVDEDIMTDEFDDPRVDIRKIKMKERYGIGILNEGKAIAVLKNVHVVPNEVVLPAQAQLDVSGSIAAIGATDNVLG
jgi:hypothetical protein